jgi:hypothetical protein
MDSLWRQRRVQTTSFGGSCIEVRGTTKSAARSTTLHSARRVPDRGTGNARRAPELPWMLRAVAAVLPPRRLGPSCVLVCVRVRVCNHHAVNILRLYLRRSKIPNQLTCCLTHLAGAGIYEHHLAVHLRHHSDVLRQHGREKQLSLNSGEFYSPSDRET